MNSTKKFRIRTGGIIGSEHQRRQVNNQDGYATGRMNNYLWGVICDGCSAGLHNETGAILLSRYLSREIPYLISSGSTVHEIPDQLFIAGLGYLRSLASHIAMGDIREQVDFVKNHLLCTVIGFVMDEKYCVIFNAGDGVFIVNDEIYRIDQGNTPLYMAYHLLHKDILKNPKSPLPLKFDARVFAMGDIDRFAVCSDGFQENIVDQIWRHASPLGLGRRLRVLRLNKKAIFSDDCTIIVVEKGNQDDK